MLTYTSVESVREQVKELFIKDVTNALNDGTRRLTYPTYTGFSSVEIMEKVVKDITSPETVIYLSVNHTFDQISSILHNSAFSDLVIFLDFEGHGNPHGIPKHAIYDYTTSMRLALTPKLLIALNYDE